MESKVKVDLNRLVATSMDWESALYYGLVKRYAESEMAAGDVIDVVEGIKKSCW